VGQRCTYEGRIPDESKVVKIVHWPPCTTKTEVHAFLGTAGTVHNWIKDYATISRPLTSLTCNNVTFVWNKDTQNAMNTLKSAIIKSLAIRPINYKSGQEVILAVDSSYIACGWILLQLDNEGRRCPSHFGSITWNERESHYSQAKIELYRLFRALKAAKVWLIGLKTFMVELDTKYIKGMLRNPDIHPNAAVNRWITGISMFDFKLRHVPGERHTGPDGLSQQPKAVGDESSVEGKSKEVEEWLDEVLGCMVWNEKDLAQISRRTANTHLALTTNATPLEIPSNDNSRQCENELSMIRTFLKNLTLPLTLSNVDHS